MKLNEFAVLVGASPKWVLNARSVLKARGPYSVAGARRLAVARLTGEAFSIPLGLAYQYAAEILHRYEKGESPVLLTAKAGLDVRLVIDVKSILAAFITRQSTLATLAEPRQRGPKVRRRNPIAAAREYGLDLSLLTANLKRTPTERLRQLDSMMRFRHKVRREDATRT
jgi:hypothetical protein